MVNGNLRGAGLMLLAMAGFTLNDTCMKFLSSELPLFQSVFLRGVGTAVLFFFIAWRMGLLKLRLSRRDTVLVVIRAMAEAISAFFFFNALFNMPLANVTAILQALPLTVTLAAAVFLREPVGWRRMLAICIGFVGVLMIVRPGFEGFTIYSVSALVAVVFVTGRDLVTKQISAKVPSVTVAFASALAVMLFAGLGTLGDTWVMPSPVAMGALLMATLCIVMGYLCVVMAMRVGELGFVSPFRYTGLVWAFMLGYLVFGEVPDMLTVSGSVLIVATGMFSLYREHRGRRRALQPKVM